MLALRFILGISIAFLIGGWVVLSIVSNGFRTSFGASRNNPLLTLVPVAAGLLLLLGLVFPVSRPLLHAGAVAALVIAALCVWFMITEAAVVVWWGIAWVAAWLWFYWRSLDGLQN